MTKYQIRNVKSNNRYLENVNLVKNNNAQTENVLTTFQELKFPAV